MMDHDYGTLTTTIYNFERFLKTKTQNTVLARRLHMRNQ